MAPKMTLAGRTDPLLPSAPLFGPFSLRRRCRRTALNFCGGRAVIKYNSSSLPPPRRRLQLRGEERSVNKGHFGVDFFAFQTYSLARSPPAGSRERRRRGPTDCVTGVAVQLHNGPNAANILKRLLDLLVYSRCPKKSVFSAAKLSSARS